jgi:geranylgeranyl diphosphate synthase type II
MLSATLRQDLSAAFSGHLPVPPSTEAQLRGAVEQILRHPGTLIRAQLASEIGRAYRLPEQARRQLAVAIEYFHTASLLLDDLPCMDDAAQRRGVPCLHHTHGEATALLTALAFVNRAYGLLWEGISHASVERQRLIVRYVERCLGLEGILNGQSQDLHYASLPPARRSPQRVAVGKTVSLIRLSLAVPALLGNAAPGEVKLLEQLALFWGLSYQILDDLKDLYAKPAETGKTGARDARLNRPNLVLAIGPAASHTRLRRFLKMADRTLARLARSFPALRFLAEPHQRFQAEMAGLQSGVP